MNLLEPIVRPGAILGSAQHGHSRRSFKPHFLGDWMRVVFLHYEVDAEVLQREVPFELDLWHGRAFVSLVAFTMQRLRLRFGGRLAAWAFKPIATTRYFNVRTYVRDRFDPGIYFIAEFLSNRLCVPLGPAAFGLPYRAGHLSYKHPLDGGLLEGEVTDGSTGGKLTYQATPSSRQGFQESRPETLDAFLLERYLAYTRRGEIRRHFQISHSPWLQVGVECAVQDQGLLGTTGNWFKEACLLGGNFSPGVREVLMERPHRIPPPERKRRLTAFFDV